MGQIVRYRWQEYYVAALCKLLGPRSPAIIWAKPTTRVVQVYGKLIYTVASIDTQCIDSNLESGRWYIIVLLSRLRGFPHSHVSVRVLPVSISRRPSGVSAETSCA